MKFTYRHTKYACYTAYIAGAALNNLAPLLFVIFERQFKINVPQLAFLITANFGTQVIVDFLGAKYADKIGYRRTVIIAHLFAVAGMSGMGILPFVFPNPYMGLLSAVVCYAIGSGMLEVMISPIIEAIPEGEKSGNMSLLHSFYCWGVVLTVLLTTLFFTVFGKENWRFVCFLWTAVPIFSGIMFCFVPINMFGNGEHVPLAGMFKSKILWVFMILMLCSGAAEQTMSQWASYFAESALGVSKTTGDLLGPCCFAVLMGISRILYGKFSNKIDLKKFMLACAALCVLAYCMTAIVKNPFIAMIGCGICGFSVGIMWPGVLSFSADKYPQGGTAMFAILALCGDCGCFVGPDLAANVSANFSIHGSGMKAGFLAAIIFPVVMILLIQGISGKSFASYKDNQK